MPATALSTILARVDAVAACGVDYVKVGIERTADAGTLLEALEACGRAVVPVLIADRGLDGTTVDHACRLGFPAVMVDTADKRAGSLFDRMPIDELHRFVERVRASGKLVGLAGALRRQHLPALQALEPDFAGFRSAVCAGDRSGQLDEALLRALVAEVRSRATLPVA